MRNVQEINPNTQDSHQTSPGYVLTFVSLQNKKGVKTDNIVVVNDAIQVNCNFSKSSPNPSLSAVLMAGDINYATAVFPGDYVFLNMLNSQQKAMEVAKKAKQLQKINKYDDGFKGMFRVQSVKKMIQTDSSGVKSYYFEINAFGFMEYNNIIYYNPVLTEFDKTGGFFRMNFNDYLSKVIIKKGNNNIQEVLKVLISALIGNGNIQSKSQKLEQSPNRSYRIPKNAAKLLGIDNAKQLFDVSKFYFGKWGGSSGGANTPYGKFNVDFPNKNAIFYEKENAPVEGNRILAAAYWNQVKIWSILQSYSNDLINEMYTCFRYSPSGDVLPSLVLRQKPFGSSEYKGEAYNTKYIDLPRWKISPDLVMTATLGREEASRINFVQVFTRSIAKDSNTDMAYQVGMGNYQVDYEDIEFNGLKPFVASSDFDYPGRSGEKKSKAKPWTNLVYDWVKNGHNKMSGTIQCTGIEEAICAGDNIEFDNVIYHIESLSHVIAISGDRKVFRTSLVLSHGVDIESSSKTTIYPETKNLTTQEQREEDSKENGILPGYSDTQDSLDRV
jgi:hypothetical protein